MFDGSFFVFECFLWRSGSWLNLVPTVLFGFVELLIGDGEEGVDGVHGFFEGGDTEAGGDGDDLLFIAGDGLLFEGFANTFGEGECFSEFGIWGDDAYFFAAEAVGGVIFADLLANRLGDVCEDDVAGDVSMVVVNFFEVIDIDDDERESLFESACGAHIAGYLFEEVSFAEESGEFVEDGAVVE